VANDSPSRAGYRVNFFNDVNGGLINSLTTGQVLDFRSRSQISAPSHTFEYVGSGTNYDALPWNGGVPVPANAIVEINNGKVYSSNTNEKGDFAVGSQFSVDGTTGTVTINTDQFNLSGLNFIGPFSRNGGFSTVGVQLQEVSNNTSLVASTGSADGNTVPTQFAVKSFYEAQASSTTPAANGTAAVGTSLRYARADHVHPSTSAGPLFRVNRSGNISGISSGALTKITFNVSTSNVESAFNLSTGVFQPATAGYYHVTFAFRASGLSIFEGCALIRQNGSTDVTKNCQISSFDTEVYTLVSDIIYLNGSTDYLEFYAQISNVSGSSGTYTITAGSDTTYACGFMIRPG
jgi:hypothetical protein